MKLIYSADALEDLVRLRAFIAEHDPAAANRIGKALVARIEHLRLFPEMGRAVSLAPLLGKKNPRYYLWALSCPLCRAR